MLSSQTLGCLGLRHATGLWHANRRRRGTPHRSRTEKRLVSVLDKSNHTLIPSVLRNLPHPEHCVFHPVIQFECHSVHLSLNGPYSFRTGTPCTHHNGECLALPLGGLSSRDHMRILRFSLVSSAPKLNRALPLIPQTATDLLARPPAGRGG